MAEKIVYNKLVRDRIPEIIEASGDVPITRILGADEIKEALLDKLAEETTEFIDSPNLGLALEELADMQEVVDALTRVSGFTLAERERVRRQKSDERGAFENRVFLESTEPKTHAKKTTLDTYDNSAPALAEYFRSIGSRVEDIERAIELRGAGSDVSVFELGCGDGRDGVAIAERVKDYRGIDYSKGMIATAQDTYSGLDFSFGDMLTTDFPQNQDIIFAFASMLHLDKDQLKTVLKKCFDSLAEGGVLYISLKEKPEYSREWKNDKFGDRLFYFYNADIILGLVDTNFTEVHRASQIMGETNWFTQAFKKEV